MFRCWRSKAMLCLANRNATVFSMLNAVSRNRQSFCKSKFAFLFLAKASLSFPNTAKNYLHLSQHTLEYVSVASASPSCFTRSCSWNKTHQAYVLSVINHQCFWGNVLQVWTIYLSRVGADVVRPWTTTAGGTNDAWREVCNNETPAISWEARHQPVSGI